MKIASLVGTILVIVGLVGLIWGGVSYTKEETLIDVGPIEATTQTRERIPMPPIIGGVALAAGVVLLIAGARRA
jgi:hypothetical protein